VNFKPGCAAQPHPSASALPLKPLRPLGFRNYFYLAQTVMLARSAALPIRWHRT